MQLSARGATRDAEARAFLTKPQSEIRTALERIIGSGPTDIIAPDVRLEEEVDAGDHIRRLLSYWVEPGDRAYGYLLLPKPLPTAEHRRPLVLCPHETVDCGKAEPAGLEGDPDLGYALHLVRRGFICFAPDQFWAGHRLESGSLPCNTVALYRRWPDWSAGGKAIWDLQRALDILVTYDFIDTDRIGAIGYSLGGHDTLMLAAFDPRIKAAVVSKGTAIIRKDPRRQRWARSDPAEYTYYRRLQPYLQNPDALPFDFDRVAMLVVPRPMLMLIPFVRDERNDCGGWLDAIGVIEERYARAGAAGAFAVYFHSPTGHFPAEAQALAYTWLEARLAVQD